jgi:hypothetical protein
MKCRPRSFAALTAENFFYSVSVALFIVLGIALLLARFVVDDPQVAGGPAGRSR